MKRTSSSACSQKCDLGIGQLSCLSAAGCWWSYPSRWYPSFQLLYFHTSYWKNCNLLQASIFFFCTFFAAKSLCALWWRDQWKQQTKPSVWFWVSTFSWVFCFTWISSRAQGSSFWWVTACSLHWSKLRGRDLDWQEGVWRFSPIKVMICLSVKCLSRQPGFIYTRQGQSSALFNFQHIPQPGFDPQQAGRWHGLCDGLAALPSGHCGNNHMNTLSLALWSWFVSELGTLLWGKMGCMDLSELEERPFSSQRL